MRRILLLIFWQFGLLAGGRLFADVVTLKDGRQISGLVESGNTQELHIKVADQSQTIDIHQVQAIQFGVSLPAPPAAPPPPKVADLAPAAPEPAPAQPNSLILNDGTHVTGRWWSIDATDMHFLVNNQLQHYPRPDGYLVMYVTGEGPIPSPVDGMRHLCKQSALGKKIAAFLVLDGASTDHITNRALGSRRFEVTFTGPGGHSWSDYGVGNPVHALSRAISQFSDARLNGPPKSSFNVGFIEGGASVNAIPPLARAKVDIRSESNEKMDELVDLLTNAIERALEIENQRATGGKVAVKIREIGSRPAANLTEHSPILSYLRAVDSHLGIRSHLDCASTDANIDRKSVV